MKILCITEKLKSKVSDIARATSKQASLPVLMGICIETSDTGITLTATNIDLGVSVTIPAKVEQPGKIVVPGDVFSKVITSLNTNEKNITIETDETNNIVKIQTESKKITLNTLSPEDFPTLPKVEGEEITISKEIFTQGVRAVSYACASSDIKPEIASVYIYTEPGEIVFVATDASRLAEKRIKTKNSGHISSLLIPYKNINELVRLIELAERDTIFTVSKTMLSIKADGLYITSRIIDGLFPDYKKIIPSSVTTEVTVLKSELNQVLKLSPVFSDQFNQTTLTFEDNGDYTTWTTKNPYTGEIVDTIFAKIVGSGKTLNFNHQYISDVLNSLDRESVLISFNDNSRAVVIKGVGDDSFRYLVMPLNR